MAHSHKSALRTVQSSHWFSLTADVSMCVNLQNPLRFCIVAACECSSLRPAGRGDKPAHTIPAAPWPLVTIAPVRLLKHYGSGSGGRRHWLHRQPARYMAISSWPGQLVDLGTCPKQAATQVDIASTPCSRAYIYIYIYTIRRSPYNYPCNTS